MPNSVIRQKPVGRQDVVVCKIPIAAVCGEEVLPESRLALELSCCLQDPEGRSPEARSLPQNALGRKLSCCLQDRRGGACDPEPAAVGGCAPPHPGFSHGIAANNPGCVIAISEGCPGRLADSPGQPRSSGGDNRRGVAAGNQAGYTPTNPADNSKAGTRAHSSGIAVLGPYRRLSHLRRGVSEEKDLALASGSNPFAFQANSFQQVSLLL